MMKISIFYIPSQVMMMTTYISAALLIAYIHEYAQNQYINSVYIVSNLFLLKSK